MVGPTQIDSLDVRLAKELEIDARQSYPGLAAKLGASSSTVRRRLNNLLDLHAITIISVTNPIALGLQTYAIFGVYVKPGKSDAVMHRFISCPDVQFCGKYVGRYDLMVSMSLNDEKEIIHFIDNEISAIPDIIGFESMIVLNSAKSSLRYLGGSGDIPAASVLRDLDEHELILIKHIQSNPRESIKALSGKLGMSKVSVSKILRRLLKENIIQVVGIINPQAFGLHCVVAIFVEAAPGTVSSVVDRVTSHPKVHHVVVTTGQFPIIMWAFFKDSGELDRFLIDELGHIPGVVRHETMQQIGLPNLGSTLTPFL